MKILNREPWRGSQICGEQIEYGVVPGRVRFCGERKAPGLYHCAPHDQAMREECGEVLMAAGNATGSDEAVLELLWEPYRGGLPERPTAEELSIYGF